MGNNSWKDHALLVTEYFTDRGLLTWLSSKLSRNHRYSFECMSFMCQTLLFWTMPNAMGQHWVHVTVPDWFSSSIFIWAHYLIILLYYYISWLAEPTWGIVPIYKYNLQVQFTITYCSSYLVNFWSSLVDQHGQSLMANCSIQKWYMAKRNT